MVVLESVKKREAKESGGWDISLLLELCKRVLAFSVGLFSSRSREKYLSSVESTEKRKDFQHMLIMRQCSITTYPKWPEWGETVV